MSRAAGVLFSLPAIVVALLVANTFSELNLVETMLGVLVIIGFAVIAAGWAIDRDV
jgi:branched-subunit amino acid transport protein AzlD